MDASPSRIFSALTAGYQVYRDESGATPLGICQPERSPDGTLNRVVSDGPAGMLCLHRTEHGGVPDKTDELVQPNGRSRTVFKGDTARGSGVEAPDGGHLAWGTTSQLTEIYNSDLQVVGTVPNGLPEGWADAKHLLVTKTNREIEVYDLANATAPIGRFDGFLVGVVRP